MKNKNELLNKELLSKIKNADELEEIFSEMYQEALQKMLEGEMENHLGFSKGERTEKKKENYRNGTGKKTVRSKFGELEIDTPRDRNASFEPMIIEKRKSVHNKIEDVVIGLYSRGMSVRDIEDQIKELYGITISDTEVSRITNKLLEQIHAWQNRPLESQYPVIWMDAIHFKIRDNYKVISKAVYIIVGLTNDGYKEALSIWIGENETSTFWMQVLDDLKARGVEDIFVSVSDNLTGLTKAISTIFPKSLTQICIVHQVRNSLNRVARKDKKAFVALLKDVYKAPNEQQAKEALHKLNVKFGKKYAWIIKSWEREWENLTVYFNFPTDIRRLIYTTNIIENLNRNIRRYTKTKNMYPNDNAALKAVFLAVNKVNRHWEKKKVANWELIISQFLELFPNRMKMNF